MRAPAPLVALALLVAVTVGTIGANAASLEIDAGVLQLIDADVSGLEPPEAEPASYEVTLTVRYFNNGKGKELGKSPREMEPVPSDGAYTIQASDPVDCGDVLDEDPEHTGTGEFDHEGDVEHVLCVYAGSSVEISSGDGVVSTTSSSTLSSTTAEDPVDPDETNRDTPLEAPDQTRGNDEDPKSPGEGSKEETEPVDEAPTDGRAALRDEASDTEDGADEAPAEEDTPESDGAGEAAAEDDAAASDGA